jgi:hypothetical protein
MKYGRILMRRCSEKIAKHTTPKHPKSDSAAPPPGVGRQIVKNERHFVFVFLAKRRRVRFEERSVETDGTFDGTRLRYHHTPPTTDGVLRLTNRFASATRTKAASRVASSEAMRRPSDVRR